MLTLGATAAVVAGGFAAVPAAQAATTWQAHDKNCRTVTLIDGSSAGSVCAEVQKRVTDTGSVTGYRGRLTVAPTAGNSLKPTTFSWSSDGILNQFCAGGCAPQTSAWSSPWSPVKTFAGSYMARGELANDDRFDVAASWSGWSPIADKCVTYTAGKVCVYRHERSYREIHQERAKLTVAPSARNWMEPRWIRVGIIADGTNTHKTRDLCDPSCTKHATNWSTTVIRQSSGLGTDNEVYASAQVALPSGEVKTIKASRLTS
ncbi:hypothetical protein [Amycolatopsis sp. YIM 10]|uniref:hypothetical protein n=1 Tax=Amycolatopsis sp. YIM 10 TaxID=2653857 RepID=UPI00129012A8|nr:hypothetical protein [Amycolatopsis sp. YIM 10]QFU88187.1 hypothetical protein YIM_15010 [Amycolatopsis sp. YIM 10]